MGKIAEAFPDVEVHIPRTLDTLIKMTYGTREKADDALGLSAKTMTRWYTTKPRLFLTVLPELMEHTNCTADWIVHLILQRDADVKALHLHLGSESEDDA